MTNGSEVFTTCPKCGSDEIIAFTTVHETVGYDDDSDMVIFDKYEFGDLYRIECGATSCSWRIGDENPTPLDIKERMLEEHMREALSDA